MLNIIQYLQGNKITTINPIKTITNCMSNAANTKHFMQEIVLKALWQI